MTNSLLRAPKRKQAAVLVVALLALTAFAVVRGQTRASADTLVTNQSMTCPIVGALNVPFTSADTPDPVDAGAQMTLSLSGSAPVPPGITATINSLTFPLPLPAQVASVDNVTFVGGNMTGSFVVAADNSSVNVVFTGPVSTTVISIPEATLHVTLKPGIAGQTINWPGPSGIVTDILGLGAQSCTATAGNPPMQSTQVNAVVVTTAPPTTVPTTAPPTTVPTTVPTTAPPTTVPTTAPTTRPPTTVPTTAPTTRPPTTVPTTAPTTRPPTTVPTTRPPTTRPPTTTPPTTAPPGGGIIEWIRKLLCLLFHIGC